jgi:3-methyl-2-oxobutanoate hydroxymethyltransferase
MTAPLSAAALEQMKARGQKIVMVTAYDAPSARLADAAGVDCILVGDSAAMTMLGHESTVSISMDEMLLFTRAVVRGAKRPLIVADMPFGSFQPSTASAVENAVRFAKEGGAHAVKLEGAGQTLERIEAIVRAGIPVVGHIGLLPQSASLLGGYKPQGRTADHAHRLCEEAVALERVGCCALVLEAMPEPVAARITEALRIPTIGIGAGATCDGQVLVWHDLLGLSAGHVPQFVKRYADAATLIVDAVGSYAADVRAGRFPQEQHTYKMLPGEREKFEADLQVIFGRRGAHAPRPQEVRDDHE